MKNPPLITPAWLHDREAGWSDEKILAAFDGRESMSYQEVASAENITPVDRAWVLCHVLHRPDDDVYDDATTYVAAVTAHNAYNAVLYAAYVVTYVAAADAVYDAAAAADVTTRIATRTATYNRHILEVELPRLLAEIEAASTVGGGSTTLSPRLPP